MRRRLRGCLDFGSAGERDEVSDGFVPDFEARSSATGRESGDEDAERSRAQPRIENLNSLSVRTACYGSFVSLFHSPDDQ